ncbi:MAG: F0F1 ATP synthase subunit gamma [Chromatiales bacterium]|nr:F0F1 ATP synthase subunit gamma [Chromatiales bacterium]
MAGAKEIRTKIKSVQSTQKITAAMEMVAASKMRRAQERMRAARPYAEKMRVVMTHLAQAHPEYKHVYLQERAEIRSVGYIVVSSDRGLAGGLNNNLFRSIVRQMREHERGGRKFAMSLIGSKAEGFFNRRGANVLGQITHIGDAPKVEDLIGTVKTMLDAFASGELDAVYLCYNEFVNTMTQRPTIEQLLPIAGAEADAGKKQHWDYIYEPDAREVLDGLLTRYVESIVYQSVVENLASEQAARMVAMKAATDNAGKMIDELKLIYNKARQASITQEISEIVGGAAAV